MGVQKETQKNGTIYFKSSITYKNKHISLGSYKEQSDAEIAIQYAKLITSNKTSLFDYTPSILIPFDKWVIIHNFRDNNYYVGNPIYMYKSYFSYFFSETIEFKFDADDLFFYAIHKINYRNGHFFINDHGQQINLLARYNIKNYAVLGKDYNVKNGDKYDLRRLNIEIYNKYNGVKQEIRKGKKKYITKIHNSGDILVGIYDNEIDAAIAYNKAIDLLNLYGINKENNKNYIEQLTQAEYLEKYKNTKISTNILIRSKQKRPIRFDEYTGVLKEKTGFRAYIGFQSKHVYLGIYNTSKQAAQAYNQAAIILYKENANLNHVIPTLNSNDYEKIMKKIKKVFPDLE